MATTFSPLAQTFRRLRWGLVRQRLPVPGRRPGTALTALIGLARFSSSASDTNRFIGQPPADDTTMRDLGAHVIFDTSWLPVAVAEIKLGHVAVQVALGAMLIDATHAALEDREVAFDGIGVDVGVLAVHVGCLLARTIAARQLPTVRAGRHPTDRRRQGSASPRNQSKTPASRRVSEKVKIFEFRYIPTG